jgi:hypothetical protein
MTNSILQDCIVTKPLRWRSFQPRIVPAGGDTQNLAHRGDMIVFLIGFHELEDSGSIKSISHANQAAAYPQGHCDDVPISLAQAGVA